MIPTQQCVFLQYPVWLHVFLRHASFHDNYICFVIIPNMADSFSDTPCMDWLITLRFLGVKVSSCYCSHVTLLNTSCSINPRCSWLPSSICYICRNNPSKYGTLNVIQIHHVSLILLFILWYAEVIVRAPSHLHKYVNELLVYSTISKKNAGN